MNELDLQTSADKIILKCSAYTGCELPFTDLFATELSESIMSFFLKMGFADLTLAEIILAMELNLNHSFKIPGNIDLQKAVFFGRCVNLTFISTVVSNYMLLRCYLDRRLQNLIDGHE